MTPPKHPKLTHHVFICTNERPSDHPRGSCGAKHSEDLIPLFKAELAKSGIRNEVRAQRAGCLDTCESGPSVVIYPEGVWYGPVRPADVVEIVRDHLIGGVPVARLRIPGK